MGPDGERRQCHLDRLDDRCSIDGCLAAQQEVLVGLRHGDFLDTIEFAHNVGPFGLAPVQGRRSSRSLRNSSARKEQNRWPTSHHDLRPARSILCRQRTLRTYCACV